MKFKNKQIVIFIIIKIIFKITVKEPRIAKIILKKRNKVGRHIPLSCKQCKTIVIKTVENLYRGRHTDQWNQVKNPELNPPTPMVK